jgi:hypothetical protein
MTNPIDLDKLGRTIAGFAKTRFRLYADEEHGEVVIQAAPLDEEHWYSLATVHADDGAAEIVEILMGSPELLRLARVGQAYVAYERARSGDDLARTLYALDVAYRAAKEPTS